MCVCRTSLGCWIVLVLCLRLSLSCFAALVSIKGRSLPQHCARPCCIMPAASACGTMSRYSATTAAVNLPHIAPNKSPLASPSSNTQLIPAAANTSDPTAFLSTLHTHVQHSRSLNATLHHHTTATLATLTAQLATQQQARTLQQHSANQYSRRSIRETQEQDREWRVRTQERDVMETNVRHRHHIRQRLEQRRRDEEDERDKRAYQQQQQIFQLQLQRLAQQAEAEQAREAEEQADEQRQQDERRQRQQVTLDERRRQWARLTGRVQVEQQWLDEWTALSISDQPSSSSLDSINGDRLNAAVVSTTPELASAGQQQPMDATPSQPQPSPTGKKGAKKDDTGPPPPPPPSLASLLASHPAAFTSHSDCRALASTFHALPSSPPSVAAFLNSTASVAPASFPAFLQHIHRIAAGPPLPCLPLHLPAFRHVISMVGSPYTGKHSQSLRLAQRLNLHLIDIYTTLASPHPSAEVAKRLLAGRCVDDELLVRLVCDEMRRVDGEVVDGVLLLDFPSTLKQAHLLCSYLTGVMPVETAAQTTARSRLPPPALDAQPVSPPVIPAGGGLTAVIELQCEARTRRSRCVGRCVDSTGVEWHRENNEMEWEQLGKEALTQVDHGATLEKQVRDWERQRSTLVDWWRQCGNKLDIDGEGSRDDVTSRLFATLDALLARSKAEAVAVELSPFEPLLDLQLARTLSSHVRRYQAAYVEASEMYVRNMRGLWLSTQERNATVRESTTQLVRSESATLDIWREEEEREEAEMAGVDADEEVSRRQDGHEKDEQHLRIDDMAARMSVALSTRHSQWRAELSAVGSDGWVERMKHRLTAASVRQLQAEVDRWLCEVRLVRDYEAGRGAVLVEDDRGEKAYEVVWPRGPAAEDKKDDKAAAGKTDKARAKAAAVVEEVRADVDVWTDVRQQLSKLLWQPAGDASNEQSKQLMAAVEAALWQRVDRVETTGRAAVEAVEADVTRLMALLDELIQSRAAAEEEEVRALCRYARRRLEAEEERCGEWLIRRRLAGEPSLVVDGGRRTRVARPQVAVSIWMKEGGPQRGREQKANEYAPVQQPEEVKLINVTEAEQTTT